MARVLNVVGKVLRIGLVLGTIGLLSLAFVTTWVEQQSGLPFQTHVEFKKGDLDARQALYRQIADQIWRPERLLEETQP